MLSENEDEENSDSTDTPLSTESLPIAASSRMQVFLRIRPTSTCFQNENCDEIYTVEDSSTLLVKHFTSNEAARRSKFTKSSDIATKKKFSISKIFNLEIGQSQFFNEAIKPAVIDFLNNQSATVISYGTADAGKTYTLFGSGLQPGAIPRSIEFIFSSLNCTLVPWYKPKEFCSVVNLDECDRALEIDTREKLLSCRLIDKSTFEEPYKTLKNSELNNNKEIFKDSMYSVWISFVEIYNDAIYDLLELDEEGKNMQLKLATDKHGATYIQGMRSVCATTGLEAYQIFNAGQMRLSTVSTSNYKSSRSHSIFTIKLLKYDKDSAPTEVKVSSLSFCDLAGTGRIQKSVGNDKQLKESRSINKSLLAFGRCLKAIAAGHLRQSIGPFRESKLTRLVQRSLCGKENIILLINVNPTVDLLAETQSVLNFATTAMKLTSESSKEDKKILEYHTLISSPKAQETRFSASAKILREQDTDDIILKNKQLTTELKELKSTMLRKEYELRQELADFYKKQLDGLEENWKNRMIAMEEEKESFLKFSVSKVKNFYKEKLDECTNRKRKRTDRGDYEDHLDAENLESENSHFSSKILSLRKSLESMKNENAELNTQKNRHAFELSMLKNSLKKLTEFIDAPHDKLGNNINFSCVNINKDETKVSLDDDVTLYLSTIEKFIKNSSKLEKFLKDSKRTIGVQCSSEYPIMNDFFVEVQELLDTNRVQLPVINDSFELSNSNQDRNSLHYNLDVLLPRIKELIVTNVSKRVTLEVENSEKSDQIKMLNHKLIQHEREIIKMKIEYQESESVRLTLSRKIKDFEIKSKSKEFFTNLDFITVESENCSTIEERYQIEQQSNSRHSLDNESRLSLFETDSEQIANSATRSSSDSSKNDSGLASSIEYVTCKVTDEKYCQTNFCCDDNNNIKFRERLLQLKFDYQKMTTQHLQESLRVTELSQELEHIREAMTNLKENASTKDQAILECQSKLNSNKVEIERLHNEKHELESKCNELTMNFQDSIREYEKEMTESQVKLKVHEEGENRTEKCLQEYWEKSVNLGSELSIAYSQLEKTSMRCFQEHILEIDKLEKELNVKKLNEYKLEEKITELEKDLAGMNDLSEKVNDFENLLDRIQKEKIDLHKIINERLRSQSEIEEQLKNLVSKIDERDSQVRSLETELEIVTRTNLSNSRRAKELGKEVAKLIEKMCTMTQDIVQSEAARIDLERSSNKEISNLRARLTIFEENAELLNLICNTNDSKKDEVNKLKAQILEKEKELDFFKKNRNATIQRYECLVRQLQEALKINHHSSKLKKILPHKQKYYLSDFKDKSVCDIHGSEPQIRDWKSFDDENIYVLSCSSIHTVAHSAEASEITANKDEPSRLIADISEKYLETEKRAYLKVHHIPCKELALIDDFDSSIRVHPFESDKCPVRITEGHAKFHLQQRKSFKEFN